MMKKSVLVLSLCGIALMFAACIQFFGTVRGGGWIPSAAFQGENVTANSPITEKATFGFTLKCDAKKNVLNGQFEYHDHGVPFFGLAPISFDGLAIHGFINKLPLPEGCTCAQLQTGGCIGGIGAPGPPGTTIAAGPYRPQINGIDIDCSTNPAACGLFIVQASDRECDEGSDGLALILVSGLYGGYANEACLGGGNITFFSK